MPDKSLTEAAWKAFAKQGSYKDAPLLKALASLDKAGKAGGESELEALDEVEKQVDLLRKAHKGDKKLDDYLSDLDKALARQRKQTEQDLAARRKAEAQAGEDEEESPALLTTKMIPLLREVRKGDLVLQALIAVAGKETVVLLSRKAISPARGKLLKEQMTNPGGLKFIRGECTLENSALTFIVQAAAGGLAKRLKAALLAQTELRLKVRVRGEDPDDVDEDMEEGGAVSESDEAPDAPTPDAPSRPDAVERARYEQRMSALEPLLMAALRAQQGDTGKLRAVAEFARGKARAEAWGAALQSLDALEGLLKAATSSGGKASDPVEVEPEATPKRNDAATAFAARLSALMGRIKAGIEAGGPRAAELKLKLSEAGALGRARDFPAGMLVLDTLEDLLDAPAVDSPQTVEQGVEDVPDEAPPSRPKLSLVQQRSFMLTKWRVIPGRIRADLGALRAVLVDTGADSDPTELVDLIASHLEDLLEEIQDAMDDAINAGDMAAFKGLAARVADDEIVVLLVDNPAIDGKVCRDRILAAMREIENGLVG